MKITSALALLLVALVPALPLKADATTSTNTPPVANPDLKIANGQSIAFMGDSITQFGWDNPGGYLHQLVTAFKMVGVTITPFPLGISGQTSRDMLKRIQQLIDRHPTWMTLSCGVNDVWHNVVSLDEYEKNVTAMVDQAQAAKIKVMILTATPIMEDPDNDFNKRLAPYNDFLRQLAKDRNLPLADVSAAYMDQLKATPHTPDTLVVTQDGVHPNPEGNFLFTRTIFAAFGATPDELSQYEAQWRQAPNAAGIYAGMAMANGIPLTAEQGQKIHKAADDMKTGGALNFEIVLCYRALCATLLAHEQDPDFAPNLNPNAITKEMNANIAKLIDALPAPPPPAVPPAPASSTSPAAPAKPTGHFMASMFMARTVPVSLATYNNVLATAQAHKQTIIQFANPIFFQALRKAVESMKDQADTLTFDQAINGLVPRAYKNFVDMLNALPPAPAPDVSASAAATTSNSSPVPAAK